MASPRIYGLSIRQDQQAQMQSLMSTLPARIFCPDGFVETGWHWVSCCLQPVQYSSSTLRPPGMPTSFLFSCGPGWLGQLEGLSLGVPGRRERHHRGQAAGSPMVDGAFRAHLWSEFLCHPPAVSADGGWRPPTCSMPPCAGTGATGRALSPDSFSYSLR